MAADRVRALVAKEWLDLSRHPATLLPVALITLLSLALPFTVAIAVPALTGHAPGDDVDLAAVSAAVGLGAGLSTDARVQLFLFQQFLMLFLVTPISGAMTLAAHAVVDEKQARTLEPLLSTPITTLELLVAKVVGALVPAMAIALGGLAAYLGGIALLALPGVAWAMLSARTAVLAAVVSPAAALLALQAAIAISSRVNDARTAQQFGTLIILPIAVVLVAQFTGALWLSAAALAAIGAGLLVMWMLVAALSVALFGRESILTRWR
jgi:ABC-2 type transport system permease protein